MTAQVMNMMNNEYVVKWEIKLNAKKTVNLVFGVKSLPPQVTLRALQSAHNINKNHIRKGIKKLLE